MLNTLYTLTTERLLLKSFTHEVYRQAFTELDEAAIIDLFGHNGHDDYLAEKERFDKGMVTFNKSFIFFQLRDKSSNQFLGWCGYHTWYQKHNRAEVFYMLTDEQQRRQGLMSEALKAVIEYGFKEMQLERIEAFVAEDNNASLALLNKFGFKQEGLFRKHYKVDGINTDSLAFGLLKEEFL